MNEEEEEYREMNPEDEFYMGDDMKENEILEETHEFNDRPFDKVKEENGASENKKSYPFLTFVYTIIVAIVIMIILFIFSR